MPPLRSSTICRPDPSTAQTTAHSLSATESEVGHAMPRLLFCGCASCYHGCMASSGLDEILDQAAPLIRGGQIGAAEQIYRRGLERFPESAILWCNLAV